MKTKFLSGAGQDWTGSTTLGGWMTVCFGPALWEDSRFPIRMEEVVKRGAAPQRWPWQCLGDHSFLWLLPLKTATALVPAVTNGNGSFSVDLWIVLLLSHMFVYLRIVYVPKLNVGLCRPAFWLQSGQCLGGVYSSSAGSVILQLSASLLTGFTVYTYDKWALK